MYPKIILILALSATAHAAVTMRVVTKPPVTLENLADKIDRIDSMLRTQKADIDSRRAQVLRMNRCHEDCVKYSPAPKWIADEALRSPEYERQSDKNDQCHEKCRDMQLPDEIGGC